MASTYIVRCSDDSYYVGSTHHLEHRLWQHNHSPEGPAYTRGRRPVVLVFSVEHEQIGAAFAFEKQVQGWSRGEREALIRGDWAGLPALAARRS